MYAHTLSNMTQLAILADPAQEHMHHFQQHYPVYQAQPDRSTAEVMHKCDHPGCDRQFNRKYTLAEHAMTHTGEKPHVCPVKTCSKSFSTSGNLSRHKRLHGYIEPLQCPVQGCICTFPSNNKLAKHMKFHYASSDDVKVCLVTGCGKTFSTTGNLNRHVKACHSGMERSSGSALTNPQRSPTAADQWTPKQQAARGHFEPDFIRPYAPVSFTPVVPGNAWGSDELDALAGLFETPFAAAPVAQLDSHTVDMFQHSLHFEYKP